MVEFVASGDEESRCQRVHRGALLFANITKYLFKVSLFFVVLGGVLFGGFRWRSQTVTLIINVTELLYVTKCIEGG